MGDIGPCGPCSEIHYDLGEGKCDKKDDPNHVCEVNAGCARYIEIWNLVFIQFDRDKESKLHNLPAKHVDTGMGFERVHAVINGTNSNYDTDLFTPLLSAIHDLTSVKYSGGEKGMAHRVISDHIRALTFAIADGAMPSNEGRGYVLRRILRRAARFGRNLDMHEPFIYKLVPVLVDIMGDAFPELKENHQFVSLVIKSEEESFNSTLDRGIEIFEKISADVEKSGQKEIPGKEAFRLYDTYGFPLDLTQLMARQKNFSVDEKGFENAMSEQRDRARKAGKWSHSADFDYQNWQELSQGEDSKFLGYTELQCESEIRKFHIEDKQIFLILSQTPFYGEAGGQVGDTGEILGDDIEIKIHNTVRDGKTIVHIGKIKDQTTQAQLIVGARPKFNPKVIAKVDPVKRKSTARNHTATHLLHKALRETLGTHVTQAGSLVAPDHLRFDVSHFQKIAPQELEKIEARVNEKVRDDLAVKTLQKTYVEAREMGAMAIFEEKYGEYVRVVKIADFSMELCGGTHLNHTGEIGYFRILSEARAAAGIRRLEAVTGAKADTLLRKEKKLSHNLQEILNCSNQELVDKVQSLLSEKHRLEKEIQQLRVKSAQQNIGQLVNSAQSLDGFKIVTSQMASKTVDELKQISDTLRAKIGSGVGVLSSVINDKASFVCVVTDDLISAKNLKAGDIIKQVAAIADGSGGGRPHMALAGGKNINKIEQALEKVPEIVAAIINK